MIRVDVETILMAGGPMPSVVVLRERQASESDEAPSRSLSIQTGAFEAAAIGRGIDVGRSERPLTHDIMLDVIDALDARIERVEITRVDAPVFYAAVVISGSGAEHQLDARPSDAIALAVRSNAPIYVEDDVMNRAGTASSADAEDGEGELERFDRFVQTLSPDDF